MLLLQILIRSSIVYVLSAVGNDGIEYMELGDTKTSAGKLCLSMCCDDDSRNALRAHT